MPRLAIRIFLGLMLGSVASAQAPRPVRTAGDWVTHGPEYPNVLALALAPNEDIYAAAWDPPTGQSAIFVSTDDGSSWTMLAPAIPDEIARQISIDPSNPSRLAAVTTRHPNSVRVYWSNNGGRVWFFVFGFSSARTDGSAFFSSGTLYIDWGSVYVGGSSTSSWVKAAPIQYLWGASHPTFDLSISDIWAGPADSVFWTTQIRGGGAPAGPLVDSIIAGSPLEFGPNWEVPCLEMAPVAYDPADPSVVYAGARGCGTVMKSFDAGRHWNPTSLSGIVAADVLVDAGAHFTVYVRSDSTLYRSGDGGDTWNPVPLPGPATTQLVLAPSSGTLYAATEGGVFARSIPRTRTVQRPSAD